MQKNAFNSLHLPILCFGSRLFAFIAKRPRQQNYDLGLVQPTSLKASLPQQDGNMDLLQLKMTYMFLVASIPMVWSLEFFSHENNRVIASYAGFLNDLHAFDTKMLRWTDLTELTQGISPTPRGSMGFVSDKSGIIYMFGGTNGAGWF